MVSLQNNKFTNTLPITDTFSDACFIVQSIWDADKIKLKIVDLSKDENNEWKGEISMDDVRSAAEELEIPFEDFLNECKRATITNGGQATFQYDIEDKVFIWRKIGQFKVMYLSVNLIACKELRNELLLDCVNSMHTMKSNIDLLKSDIELHKTEHKEFVDRYEKYISVKNEVEKKMLTKVAAVLNAKKDKIAELQGLLFEKNSKINKNNSKGQSHDDCDTSEEEMSGNKSHRSMFSQQTQVLPKRKKTLEGMTNKLATTEKRPPQCIDLPESNSDEDIFGNM